MFHGKHQELNSWQKKGKKLRAKTLEALKELYRSTEHEQPSDEEIKKYAREVTHRAPGTDEIHSLVKKAGL